MGTEVGGQDTLNLPSLVSSREGGVGTRSRHLVVGTSKRSLWSMPVFSA